MTHQTPPVGQGSGSSLRDTHRDAEGTIVDALKSARAWLYSWGEHVGSCRGGGVCTCGLTAIRAQAAVALEENERHHPDPVPPVVGWQDISTAPRDGTGVIAFVPGFGMGSMVLSWFDGYWREPANCLGLKVPPTHWQPLPAPPAETVSPGMEAEGRNEPNPNTTAGDRT